MRFCTSELKVAPITSELKRLYPFHPILNVSGIRRQESAARSRMPVSAIEARLNRKAYAGAKWNPIIEWTADEVFAEIQASGLALHEAYTRFGSSRVSCAFCIMSSARDLQAATTCCDNHDVYRAMVELEADSTFAFQGTRWLADVAPLLLPFELRHRVSQAKKIGLLRQAIEAEIPNHLLYAKGWPTSIPTVEEATLVASVRRRISELFGLDVMHTTAESVRARYAELLEEKRARETKSGRRRKRR
jgi:3'-phosphoadenosine 5'-phosphosulfate sulfotransferase (PAPS reductase)/FAD synthetase